VRQGVVLSAAPARSAGPQVPPRPRDSGRPVDAKPAATDAGETRHAASRSAPAGRITSRRRVPRRARDGQRTPIRACAASRRASGTARTGRAKHVRAAAEAGENPPRDQSRLSSPRGVARCTVRVARPGTCDKPLCLRRDQSDGRESANQVRVRRATNYTGRYSIPYVNPGACEMRVEMPGASRPTCSRVSCWRPGNRRASTSNWKWGASRSPSRCLWHLHQRDWRLFWNWRAVQPVAKCV